VVVITEPIWYYGLHPTDGIQISGRYYHINYFFPKINVLFNIMYLVKKNSLYQKVSENSFRNYFSLEDNLLLCDSGSFVYYRKNKDPPPLLTLIDRYDLVQPDFVVHNDIPVSFFVTDYTKKEKFLKKNIENAKTFLIATKNKEYLPIGVAQGLTRNDYYQQIKQLYHLGYDYIGIGGIAKKGTKFIRLLLESVSRLTLELKIKLHIFGVGRFKILNGLPIHSFDNTIPLQDAHRDSIGKVSYFYIINKRKILEKIPLIKIANEKLESEIECFCPVCEIFGEEIYLTGKAPRNRARAVHNASVYDYYVKQYLTKESI